MACLVADRAGDRQTGRKRAPEETQVEIDSLVGSAEEMLRRLLGEAVQLQVRLGAHRAYVHCDAGRVQYASTDAAGATRPNEWDEDTDPER